jgi:hypothetical protein
MAKSVCDVKSWKIKPYPDFHEGTIRFGSISLVYGENRPTNADLSQIYLAPRYPDLLACLALTIGCAIIPLNIWLILWCCFWGCGIIDLLIGSLGFTPSCDLRKASRVLDINPWFLRVVGFFPMIVSIIASIWLFLTFAV